jgi:hypothetical protein
MPIHPCRKGRRTGYQYGPTGKCYVGADAYQRALRQARAIHARQRATTLGAVEPKLDSLYPDFRPKIEQLLVNLAARTDARGKPWRPRIYYAWRSPAEQRKLVERGDSNVLFSFHNVIDPDGSPQSLAVDIIDRRYAWDLEDKESAWTTAQRNRFWTALGEEAEALGLTWGGRWTDPYDPAHVQAYSQESDARLYLARGNWPPPGTDAVVV